MGGEVAYSMRTAAQLLADELKIRLTRQALFERLVDLGWAYRHDEGYRPTALAVADELLAVQPSRVPATGVVWDQLVLTAAGLALLRTQLEAGLLIPQSSQDPA